LKKILIVLSILLLITGCSITEKNDEVADKKVIAISSIVATHAWPAGVWDYAQDEIKKIADQNGWDYICVQAKDANEQSTQVIELIEKDVDCIILLPMDGASLKTAAKAVKKAGIPLVIFDREIPDFAPTATVKGDNIGIGIKTARVLNNRFSEGTHVLEIMGDTSTVPFQRTAGFDETISTSFSKSQLGYTGWQRKQSQDIFEKWLKTSSQQEIDEIEAIFTHDDEIALGVLDALDANKQDSYSEKTLNNLKVIASSSGSQEMYLRIDKEKDYYLFSFLYSPAMIKQAIQVSEKIIKGEPYEEMTIIPTQLIDKNNVAQYIDADLPF